MGPDQAVTPPPPPGYSASDVVPVGASPGTPPPPPGYSAADVVPTGQGGAATDFVGGAKRFLGSAWDAVNPIKGIVSTAKAIAHPIDTLNADAATRHQIGQEATTDSKSGGIVGGLSGIVKRVESMAPLIGPALHQLGNQFESGDVAGGMGSALGMAANLAVPEAVKGADLPLPRGIMERTARRQYQKALKPPPTYDMAETAKAVQGGLTNEIPVGMEGIEKARGIKSEGRSKINTLIDSTGDQQIIEPPIRGLRDVEDSYKLGGRRSTDNPAEPIADVQRVREGIVDQLQPRPGEVAYHGSSVDPRSVPESDLYPGREGFFATESPEHAKWYANSATRNESPGVGKLYVADPAKAPLDLRTPEAFRPLVEHFEKEAARLDAEGTPYSGLFGQRTGAFRQALEAGADPKTLISKMLDAAGAHAKATGKGSEIDASFVRRAVRDMGHDAYLTTEAIPESGSPTRYKTTTYLDRPGVTPYTEGDPLPPRNMTAREAQNLKTSLNAELGADKAYGKLSGATATAKKAVVLDAKNQLNAAFPELNGLNAQQGGILALEPLIERRVMGELNRDPVGIVPPAVAAAVHAATGSGGAAVAAGFMKRVIDTPLIRSKLAIGLYRASKGAISMPEANLRVQGFVNSLGQGANAATAPLPADRASQ